jgi:hypothetical protein
MPVRRTADIPFRRGTSNMSEWSLRRRTGFVNELRRMLAEQRDLVKADLVAAPFRARISSSTD